MDITSNIFINEIIPLLSFNQIEQLCQTDRSIRNICQDEKLWEILFNRDFPGSGSLPSDLSWFQFYLESYKYRQFINQNYPIVPSKPDGISWYDYAKLLNRSNKIKLIYVSSFLSEVDLGYVYIIPRITTLRSLLKEIGGKTNVGDNYNIFTRQEDPKNPDVLLYEAPISMDIQNNQIKSYGRFDTSYFNVPNTLLIVSTIPHLRIGQRPQIVSNEMLDTYLIQ